MSRVDFFGTKNEYDEEQSRQRYLQYLRVASQNSALKESAEYETEPLKAQEKPITEILSDEAEISRVLQEYLGKLLIPPDARKRNINETDEDYEQRINPVMYVVSRLYPNQKKLILTNFQQILTDTQNIKMLPRALLEYVENYQRLYNETGGVKGFPNTSAVIAEIRALQHLLPNTTQLQRSINNLRGAQALFKREFRIESANLNNLINDVGNRLQNLNSIVRDINYNRIQQIVNQGVQDVAQGNRIVADDVYARLVERLERLPTGQEIEAINTQITRQIENVARNVREGGIRNQADKIEILSQLDNAFTQIDSVLMDIKSEDLIKIKEILKNIYEDTTNIDASNREVARTTDELVGDVDRIKEILEEREMEREIRQQEVSRERELIRQQSGGRGLKKKLIPRMSLISGRGIHIDDEPKFYEFGKYVLNNKKLNERRLDVKTLKSGNAVKDLSNIPISEDLTDILTDLVNTQKLNEKHLHRLHANEKRIFSKLINGSGLYGKYKVKLVPSQQEQQENERFEMVKGIYTAGNDSQEVIKELKQFIIKFMNDGRIPRKEGLEILYELNVSSV
jgi:hypothetical protein